MKDINFKGNPKAGLLDFNDEGGNPAKNKKKQNNMPKFNANLLEFDDPYSANQEENKYEPVGETTP